MRNCPGYATSDAADALPYTVPMTTRFLLLLIVLVGPIACTRLFFYPDTTLLRTPATLGLEYEDVWLTSNDGTRLHGWWIPGADPAAATVYFLHGNAENISTHIGSVLWLATQGHSLFLLDYRGYGLSSGRPDLPEVLDDIDAGWRWLLAARKAPEATPLIVFGQSLGAALAMAWLADTPDAAAAVDGLIVEAAFTRYGTIGRHVAAGHWLTWWAQYPVQWLLPGRHDPIDALDALRGIPTLVVHSPDDAIVPISHGRRLFAAAGEPKGFVEAVGPHIGSANDPAARRHMLRFITAIPARAGAGTTASQ